MLMIALLIALYATTIEIFGVQVGVMFGTFFLFGMAALIKISEVTGLDKWLEEHNE